MRPSRPPRPRNKAVKRIMREASRRGGLFYGPPLRRQRLRFVRGRRKAPQLTRSVLPPLLERARLPRLFACKRAHDGAAALCALSRALQPLRRPFGRYLPLHRGGVVGKGCALFADGAKRRSSHAPFCLLSSKGPACRACSLASALTTARLRFAPFLGLYNPSAGRSAGTSPCTGEASSAKAALRSRRRTASPLTRFVLPPLPRKGPLAAPVRLQARSRRRVCALRPFSVGQSLSRGRAATAPFTQGSLRRQRLRSVRGRRS